MYSRFALFRRLIVSRPLLSAVFAASGFFMPISSMAGISEACQKLFKRADASFMESHFEDPLARALVAGYRIGKKFKWFNKIGGRGAAKKWEKELRETIHVLEHASVEGRFSQNLTVSPGELTQKISEIMRFSEKQLLKEDIYFGKIMAAVMAVAVKYLPELARSAPGYTDWPRMNLILNSIAEFDSSRPRYSLYKIKRAIEGRYSLKEFILCKR